MIIEASDTLTNETGEPKATPVLLTASGTPATTQPSGSDLRARIHSAATLAHEAIDKLEQRLGSTGQGLLSTKEKGGEQVRAYGDQLRGRVTTQPMKSIGIALGAGFVLSKLFGRKRTQVRVVHVREPAPTRWRDAGATMERSGGGLMHAARRHLERVADATQSARDRVSETASHGLDRTQGLASTLASAAGALPSAARSTAGRLVSTSKDYGSAARSTVQAHPAVGVGAALGMGALIAVLVARR